MKILLEAVGGSITLDEYDLVVPPTGRLEYVRYLDMTRYQVRWVEND